MHSPQDEFYLSYNQEGRRQDFFLEGGGGQQGRGWGRSSRFFFVTNLAIGPVYTTPEIGEAQTEPVMGERSEPRKSWEISLFLVSKTFIFIYF